MIPKKFNTETIVTVVTDYGMAFLVLGSGVARTVESDRNLSRDMFAPIQGELSELTYRW
jgi:hypothetical protein